MGGAGARGVRVQLRPPPGVAVSSGGEGTSPQPRGGWRAGAPVAPQAGGGGVGGRGEGGPRRCSPSPWPGGVARGPRPCPPPSPAHPPWVYTFSRGCWAAMRAGRGPVSPRWVSVAGGGGGRGRLATVCSPAFPRRAPRRAALSAHSWVPPSRCSPRRRCRAVGRQRVMRE